jgi:hypothetical protein
MLAGAEPVDAVVAAAAQIGLFSQTANFHLGAAAAQRLRTKPTETGMAVFESFDRQSASSAPAPGFMLIASVAAGGEAGRSSTAFALRLPAEFRLDFAWALVRIWACRLGASLGMTTLWSKDQC